MKYLRFGWFVSRLAFFLVGTLIQLGLVLSPLWLLAGLVLAVVLGNVLIFVYISSFFKFLKSEQIPLPATSLPVSEDLPRDVAAYQRVLQLQPTHRDLLLNTAELLKERGQGASSQALEDQAYQLDPLLNWKQDQD